MSGLVSKALTFFFLLTPFFGLSMFITMTSDYTPSGRRMLALRVSVAAAVIGLILFFFGHRILELFGITVDAFRVGTGVLLMLTAISLMNPKPKQAAPVRSDIAVIPLAMPIFIGPATLGTLVVLSADVTDLWGRVRTAAAWLLAIVLVWLMLMGAAWLEHHLGRRGLGILMRLTALILAALSAQMILSGIKGFLFT